MVYLWDDDVPAEFLLKKNKQTNKKYKKPALTSIPKTAENTSSS